MMIRTNSQLLEPIFPSDSENQPLKITGYINLQASFLGMLVQTKEPNPSVYEKPERMYQHEPNMICSLNELIATPLASPLPIPLASAVSLKDNDYDSPGITEDVFDKTLPVDYFDYEPAEEVMTTPESNPNSYTHIPLKFSSVDPFLHDFPSVTTNISMHTEPANAENVFNDIPPVTFSEPSPLPVAPVKPQPVKKRGYCHGFLEEHNYARLQGKSTVSNWTGFSPLDYEAQQQVLIESERGKQIAGSSSGQSLTISPGVAYRSARQSDYRAEMALSGDPVKARTVAGKAAGIVAGKSETTRF